MADKIGGLDNRPVQVGGDRAIQRSKDAPAQGSVADKEVKSSEPVHITGSARQLATLEQKLKDLPAIDAARVAQVRESIDSGRYEVSGERVAAKLISLEQQLAVHSGKEK